MSGFHGAFATGVASQQGTLTLPDTWFRPPFWDLLMLQLLRPNSSNLPCLYSTFHLEYPLVLSRFCLEYPSILYRFALALMGQPVPICKRYYLVKDPVNRLVNCRYSNWSTSSKIVGYRPFWLRFYDVNLLFKFSVGVGILLESDNFKYKIASVMQYLWSMFFFFHLHFELSTGYNNILFTAYHAIWWRLQVMKLNRVL